MRRASRVKRVLKVVNVDSISQPQSSLLKPLKSFSPFKLFKLFKPFPLLSLLLLSSCILVDDFSPQWEKGKTDSCTSKIASGIYYSEFRRNPEGKEMNDLAHVMTLGQQHFLMLKQDTADKGGRMYRFRVINGIFQRYRLNPVMKKQFEQDYPNAPVSLAHDTVTLAQLGPKEIALLDEIADKKDYWEIEDQILYNTALNPLCIYEDRDLEKLKAKKAKK